MQLPENSIGISDILGHGECPRRMTYGMRRHTGEGQQSDVGTPEATTYYGSALHEALEACEEGWSDADAVQRAVDKYGHALSPEDVDLLHADIATYHDRDVSGMTTVASEEDMRVPLFVHEGEQIWFRFKLDRLYRSISIPSSFVHVDYKSSAHPKRESEIHADLQLWAYNWAIHEYEPECEDLLQLYEALRYGQVPTRKTPEQRDQIKRWLIGRVIGILNDEDWQEDGLLAPRWNKWCKWCPIMESCSVVDQLTEFALVQIAALAPEEKVGRKTVVALAKPKLPVYTAKLEEVRQAVGVLERFADSVKELLRELPAEERATLGFELRGRKGSKFSPEAAALLHERLGSRFYELVKITKSGLESNIAEDPDLLSWALGLAEETAGTASVVPAREAA